MTSAIIEQIYQGIRRDIIRNQRDLLNLQNLYTHKYRSADQDVDINVGIYREDKDYSIVQIYVGSKYMRVRDRLRLTNDSLLVDSVVTRAEYEYEPITQE